MAATLQHRIAEALGRVRHPRTGRDVMESGAVRDIATTTVGRVRLTLQLAPGDDPALARVVRQAVEQVEGVADVTVDVVSASHAHSSPPAKPAGRMLPVMENRPAPAKVPAPTPVSYPNLGKIIAV